MKGQKPPIDQISATFMLNLLIDCKDVLRKALDQRYLGLNQKEFALVVEDVCKRMANGVAAVLDAKEE